MQNGGAANAVPPSISTRSEIFLYALAGQLAVSADGHGKFDIVLFGEGVEPIQELLQRMVGDIGIDDLRQAVDEHVGNIIVAGIQKVPMS